MNTSPIPTMTYATEFFLTKGGSIATIEIDCFERHSDVLTLSFFMDDDVQPFSVSLLSSTKCAQAETLNVHNRRKHSW